MLLLCNKGHKEVAFEGTNRELDCPVCKLLEEKEIEIKEMEEKGAKFTEGLSRGIKNERRTYVPYGGIDYAPWERHKPITK